MAFLRKAERARHLIPVAFATLLACPHLGAQPAPLPPGAPTDACDSHGARSLDNLRVLQGSAPVPYVFACGQLRPASTCVSEPLQPGSPNFPTTTVIGLDHTQGAWSCIFADGVSGWVPSDRLAPLPATPAIPIADWLGSWRSGPDTPGVENDRLLLTRSPANPRVLHVKGTAFWYGIVKDDIHTGDIDADAVAKGPYLHIVDGDDDSACILDLTFDPATHTFTAADNSQCGGVNVRFAGTWNRFTPTARHPAK